MTNIMIAALIIVVVAAIPAIIWRMATRSYRTPLRHRVIIFVGLWFITTLIGATLYLAFVLVLRSRRGTEPELVAAPAVPITGEGWTR